METSRRPLAFLSLGLKYIQMSELAASELVRSHEWSSSQTDDSTWSVSLHATPALFTFLHGVELMLKGCLAACGGQPSKNHGLTKSLRQFREKLGCSDDGIADLLTPYISNVSPDSLLGRALAENHLGIDKWYEFLRYPESNKGVVFDHWELRRESRETREFWIELATVARELQIRVVRLGRSRGWDA